MTLHWCNPCGKSKIPDTMCLGCRTIYYCSQQCHDRDATRHRNNCFPSVPVEGATSIKSQMVMSSTLEKFEQDSILRRGSVTKPPLVVGRREISADLRNFVTVRLRIDPRRHTSIYLCTDVDIRWRLPGLKDDRWSPPAVLDLLPGDDTVMLIAPGEKMVADLERRRAAAQSDSACQITVPNNALIDFAQSIPSRFDDVSRQTIAHVVEWYEDKAGAVADRHVV